MRRGQLSPWPTLRRPASQRASEPTHSRQDGRTWAIIGASSGLPREWPGPATSAGWLDPGRTAFGHHPRLPVAQGCFLVMILGSGSGSGRRQPQRPGFALSDPVSIEIGRSNRHLRRAGKGGSSGFLECGLRRSVDLPASGGWGWAWSLNPDSYFQHGCPSLISRARMKGATTECKRPAPAVSELFRQP